MAKKTGAQKICGRLEWFVGMAAIAAERIEMGFQTGMDDSGGPNSLHMDHRIGAGSN